MKPSGLTLALMLITFSIIFIRREMSTPNFKKSNHVEDSNLARYLAFTPCLDRHPRVITFGYQTAIPKGVRNVSLVIAPISVA